MKRFAIYARYSSEMQRDASIEDQVRRCKAEIEKQGGQLGETYADRAISGSSRFRPSYQKLLEDTRIGSFDVVISEALDRLSRDQEDIAGLFKRLKFQGIKLITLSEGEISELHVGLKGTMNALFLKDLADKTHRGLEGRVRAGKSAGGKAFGYDVVRRYSDNGEPIAGDRKINIEEAETVRRIFALFAAGQSPIAIAKLLNTELVPGTSGRLWSDTTIRGHATRRTGILRNDLYRGKLVWNKQRYVKDPNTGNRLARVNPQEEWIWQDVEDLRIVDEKLWEKVQTRLDGIRSSPAVAKARKTRFWENRRAKHLLTGIIVCGECGSPLATQGRDYLACSKARRFGTCANRNGIKRSRIEDLVLSGLKDQLMEPHLVEEFIRAYHKETNASAADQTSMRGRIERELGKVSKRLDALIEAMADGYRSESLQEKLSELEARKAGLKTELDAPLPSPVRFHPKLAEVYRQKVEDLSKALSDPLIRDEAFAIIRGLIQEVVIKPGANRSFDVELVGEITKMLALPEGTSRLDDSSVKVVAGVGFEPTTFRL
jgi:site-specific DNA recombinase